MWEVFHLRSLPGWFACCLCLFLLFLNASVVEGKISSDSLRFLEELRQRNDLQKPGADKLNLRALAEKIREKQDIKEPSSVTAELIPEPQVAEHETPVEFPESIVETAASASLEAPAPVILAEKYDHQVTEDDQNPVLPQPSKNDSNASGNFILLVGLCFFLITLGSNLAPNRKSRKNPTVVEIAGGLMVLLGCILAAATAIMYWQVLLLILICMSFPKSSNNGCGCGCFSLFLLLMLLCSILGL